MTTSMKHTPGPWVEKGFSGLHGSDGEQVIVWGLAIAHGQRTATTEANAKLIAAAPELLLACQETLTDLQFSEVPQHKTKAGKAGAKTLRRCMERYLNDYEEGTL